MSARSWLILFLALPVSLSAQYYRVDTIGGSGTFGGDGGQATAALVAPGAVVVDATGDIYIADNLNYRIRKINSSGTISTLIGKGYGVFSGDNGPATSAGMSTAASLALDHAGNLYFTDDGNLRIREVTTAGTVRTIAGNGQCGTATAGLVATEAPLCDAESVAVDAQRRVYFGSSGQIWMVASNGTLVLIAGTGGFGNDGDGGPAVSAQIGFPGSMTFDASGNLFIADQFNFVIREVTGDKLIHTAVTVSNTSSTTVELAADPSGNVFYVTGTTQAFRLTAGNPVAATLTSPNDASDLAVDGSGAIYLSSITTSRLLKVSGSTTTVVAGSYPFDVDPLPKQATLVRLHLNPLLIGLAVDAAGNVYFPELDGDLTQRIDKITPAGTMSALNTPALLPTGGQFTVQAVTISKTGQVYFSTFTQVYRLESNGSVTLIAGAPGFPSNLGDGEPATMASISNPSGLAFDPSGNLYITEPFNSRVRKVNNGGIISTFAGTGHAGYSGDGGQASNAKLSTPVDVKCDSHGNVYIADLTASVVRKVATNGIITTVAGNGTKGSSGDHGPAIQAELSGAAAIAVDPAGNIFIADHPSAASTISPATDNNRIRMVDTAGVITTLAGPTLGYNGEGILSRKSAMGDPVALATDAQGNLYVNESGTQRIRKLTLLPTRKHACCE